MCAQLNSSLFMPDCALMCFFFAVGDACQPGALHHPDVRALLLLPRRLRAARARSSPLRGASPATVIADARRAADH